MTSAAPFTKIAGVRFAKYHGHGNDFIVVNGLAGPVPLRVKDQQTVYQALRRAGVEVVLHYVPPIYRQPVYSGRLRGADCLPVTDQLVQEIICLPVTVELDESDTRYVVDTLRDLL